MNQESKCEFAEKKIREQMELISDRSKDATSAQELFLYAKAMAELAATLINLF